MELWDILDEDGNATGRTIMRGNELKEDEYHLVVHIWIINNKGEILIQKRSEHLEFAPGVWATTGGSAIKGEDSITAACRETKEELGIVIKPTGNPIRYKQKNNLTDTWIVESNVDLEDIILQKEEVSDVRWVTVQELKTMINNGEFYRSSDEYFHLLGEYFQVL